MLFRSEVADVDVPLLEDSLQMCDPLLVATGELFCLTLPLEIIVKELSMTVRPPIRGLRVHVNPVDERVPHLLLE